MPHVNEDETPIWRETCINVNNDFTETWDQVQRQNKKWNLCITTRSIPLVDKMLKSQRSFLMSGFSQTVCYFSTYIPLSCAAMYYSRVSDSMIPPGWRCCVPHEVAPKGYIHRTRGIGAPKCIFPSYRLWTISEKRLTYYHLRHSEFNLPNNVVILRMCR